MKKQKETLVTRACREVTGFLPMYQTLEQKVVLLGRSPSTLKNYSRGIAHLALFYQQTPLDLADETINEYLMEIASTKSPSASFFKHTVYGLRFLFRLFGREDRAISLPPIKRSDKLPVVLNRQEIKGLLNNPKLLKHRVLFGLIYDSGIRLFEAQALHIADIDAHRKTLFVRKGKYGKSRYVPISDHIIRGINTYIHAACPKTFLFNGYRKGLPMSKRAIQDIMRQTVKRVGIQKKATVHTLRHSYATHFLEQTGDLFSLKENLGHARIDTTLVYVHIVGALPRSAPYSPLSGLFPSQKSIQ